MSAICRRDDSFAEWSARKDHKNIRYVCVDCHAENEAARAALDALRATVHEVASDLESGAEDRRGAYIRLLAALEGRGGGE